MKSENIEWEYFIDSLLQIKCSVDTNDRTIDLSPLVQNPDNIVHSTDDGSVFYVSVCSALTPTSSVLCPAGSGVCQVKPNDGVQHTVSSFLHESQKLPYNLSCLLRH